MPANFPEIWLDRVIHNLTTADVAPFLDGIPELDTEVIELGQGTATEANAIHVPTTDFEVDVLINNNTYPIPLQAYTDSEIIINLDKLQTKVVTISDDQAMGASYDRIDAVTRKPVQAITIKKFAKAIHAIAPQADGADTPVIEASGAADANGRKALLYKDLVDLKGKLDKIETPVEGRRLVLSTDHWNDLLKDRDNFGNLLIDYREGTTAPRIAGFDIYQYINMPHYDNVTKAKKAFGAIPAANDRIASVAFFTGNIAKKTGLTKQYFVDARQDPENQTNKLAYRHYYIALPFRAKYIGAII